MIRHHLAAGRRDHVSDGPSLRRIPIVSFDTGRSLVRWRSLGYCGGLVDDLSAFGKRLGSSRQHVGDAPSENLQTD